MIIPYLPVIICIVGLLVYLLADGKPSEAGKWAFIVGLFVTLWKGIV